MRPRHERLAEYQRLTELLPRAKAELMNIAGVRDVAVGVKEVDGKPTDVMAFRVYLDAKKRPDEVPRTEMIPREVLGVPTDVVLEPVPKLIDDDDKYRPLLGGIQIGNDTTSATGTLGCLAQLNTDGSVVALSNHHVMTDGGAVPGEKIGQPVISCCCCCKGNIVGTLVAALDNTLVDCAIARLTGQPGFITEVVDIGLILGSAPLNGAGSTVLPSDRVRKRGARTELTVGTVLTPLKAIGGKINQIEIGPATGYDRVANRGDSGSVVVNDDNQVVGLLWSIDAATEKKGFANLITNVVSAMNITIINPGTAGTIPLGSAPSAEEASGVGVDDAPLREITKRLERSAKGRDVLALFDRHGHEINDLLNDNREVKVAWHRFQGPSFTAHVMQSAREPDHRIPPEIEGVTPANLLIRMSVVLQDHGSPALAEAVDAHTLPVLELLSSVSSVRDLLERFPAEDDTVDVVDALPAASA